MAHKAVLSLSRIQRKNLLFFEGKIFVLIKIKENDLEKKKQSDFNIRILIIKTALFKVLIFYSA